MSEQTPEPLLLGPFFSDGQFKLYVPTIRGRTYVLESNRDIESPAWTSVASIEGNGNWNTINDPTTIAGRRFYRVRVER